MPSKSLISAASSLSRSSRALMSAPIRVFFACCAEMHFLLASSCWRSASELQSSGGGPSQVSSSGVSSGIRPSHGLHGTHIPSPAPPHSHSSQLHFSFEDLHVHVSFVQGVLHSPDDARTHGSSTSSQVHGRLSLPLQQGSSFGQHSGWMSGGP